MFDLDKSAIEIPCPSCKFPNIATIREARFGLMVPCRGCRRRICLVPTDGGMGKAKRAIESAIREFPKGFTLEI
jgi:hypothetical protein